MRPSTRIAGTTLVGLLTLLGIGVTGFGAVTHAHDGKFEGPWLNDVEIVTCPPAPPAVLFTFQTMTTHMRGGILVEGGGSPGLPPAVWRSSGHGIWERTGRHTFRAFFRVHRFDNLGRLVRISEITLVPTLFSGDNPETPDVVEPYYLSGPGIDRLTILNPVDGSVIAMVEGCSEVTARPILFED
jgi:hypothetical protein